MDEPDTIEAGPIRPPSEAGSYLLRLTRNCPWNRCSFCRTYKNEKFSLREPEEIERDIDAMAKIRARLLASGTIPDWRELRLRDDVSSQEEWMVLNALAAGGHTAFLQDADSLVMKPDNLRRILAHFKKRFPEVIRITTYARSRTLARLSPEDLRTYRELGLTRVHIGMETGHDPLLELIKKGATAEFHIRGGRNAVDAGLEVSEYVMPGLGGREMSEGHVLDTARVLNTVAPHFIRLRTLSLGPSLPLWETFNGPDARLAPLTEVQVVGEIRRLIEALEGIRSRLVSDHIMNLLGDLEGQLPGEKQRLLDMCDAFLELPPEEQRLFQAGRRAGLLTGVQDLEDLGARARSESVLAKLVRAYGPGRLEEGIQELKARFV
ncbi:MAG: radical SAM protein [Syntrophus sp. (in: bacteria)]|nr:radical SAM protein [Syntrophus sp. (in: bacteria)]